MSGAIERALRNQIAEDLFFGDTDVELADDADLFELGLDSLGINRLIVFLERRFKARLSDGDIVPENFRTVAALLALVARTR